KVTRACNDAKAASNWVTNQVLATLNERKQTIEQFGIPAARLGELIAEQRATGLNKQRALEVYACMLAEGVSAQEALRKVGVQVVSDTGALAEIVRRAVAANPKAVADYKKGKVKAADAIKGAVMRETKGSARADLVQKLLEEELAKAE